MSQQQFYSQSNLSHDQFGSLPISYPTPQYGRTGAEISTHSNMGQTVTDERPYLQLPANTAHYSQPGTNTHTPDLSYSTTPDPLYQENFQHLPHQQSHSQSHYDATSAYIPDLDAHLQANSRSTTSSLSPASNPWTDEVYSSSAHSNAGVRPSTTSSLSNAVDDNLGRGTANPPKSSPKSETTPIKSKKGAPRVSGPGRPSASSARQTGNAGRTSAKRKRAKKSETELETQLYQFEGGSGSDSDEEDLGINMSMEGGISVGMGGLGVVTSAGKVGRM